MDIKTKSLGIVNIDKKPKFQIPSGLFGFEEEKKYVLLESDYSPFFWLQSIENDKLAFLVVDPFTFFSDYEIDLDDGTVEDLGIKKPSDVMILTIITIPKEGKPITANLQGPLVINKRNNIAKQVILDNPQWTTKHSLHEAMQSKRGDKC
ncbi:MAG: flagellar assembly protein FliW [Treponema sp. CETP13]|nr:MAG: flagellar assembly protein FliW [Treponema sp. CETP13]